MLRQKKYSTLFQSSLRVLVIVFLITFSKSWGQATLPMSRTAWSGAEPTGWTNSGCGQRATSFACTGSDGTIFDTNGDSRTVFFGSAPNQLVFKLKKSTMSGASSLLVQESPDGIIWTTIGNYGTAAGATVIVDCGDITLTLNCLSRYIRWTYTKATGNCDMDDVSISSFTGVCVGGCVAPMITSQPTSASTTTAGTASYTVVASGTSPTYQWQQNNGAGFTNIINGGSNPSYSGATSSLLTISNPPLSISGSSFQCVVSNTCGTATTNGTATITITSSADGSCAINGAMGASYNAGCGSGTTTPCDLASVYSSFGTFCGASAIACGTLCAVTNVSTTYNFESGCTATITAEFKARTIAGSNCSNSAMDSGDKLSIVNVGGVVSNQSSTMVVASTCGTYPLAGTYTTSTSNLTTGCGNSGGLVQMVVTGGAITIAGTMDRGDEILTYTLNTSGTCSLCPVLLPVGFVDFYGIKVGENNEIFWKVIDEVDIEFYMIEKSNDGMNFELYVTKQINYNDASAIKIYSIIDDTPYADITYYRISVRERFGITKIYNIISLDRSASFDWKSNHYQQEQNLVIEFKNSVPKHCTISLFDLSGKLLAEEEVKNSQTKINVQNFAEGIYFVRITTSYKTENFKIIIQK